MILSGDTIAVVMDRRAVSVMYSYPNHIPLAASEVEVISDRLSRYRFDRVYGAFPGRVIRENAEAAVHLSLDRYVDRLTLRRPRGSNRSR